MRPTRQEVLTCSVSPQSWLSTVRHVATESRSFVVGCCQAVHKNDIPDRLPFNAQSLADVSGWLNPGD